VVVMVLAHHHQIARKTGCPAKVPGRVPLRPVAEDAGRSSLVTVLAQISLETSRHHSPALRARLLEVVVVVVEIAVVAAGAVGSPVEGDRERSLMKVTPSVRLIDLGFVGTCTSIIQNQLDIFVYDHHVYTAFPTERLCISFSSSGYVVYNPAQCILIPSNTTHGS
jgi:hypothetical protein